LHRCRHPQPACFGEPQKALVHPQSSCERQAYQGSRSADAPRGHSPATAKPNLLRSCADHIVLRHNLVRSPLALRHSFGRWRRGEPGASSWRCHQRHRVGPKSGLLRRWRRRKPCGLALGDFALSDGSYSGRGGAVHPCTAPMLSFQADSSRHRVDHTPPRGAATRDLHVHSRSLEVIPSARLNK